MNIALIGYGKMGKAIEEIASKRGHTIILKIDEFNTADFNEDNFRRADVAIEFTGPHSAFENVRKAIQFGTPVVCGSTGWAKQLPEIEQLVLAKKTSFIHTSNFSVGVNIFFEINKKLAAMMVDHPDYTITLEETHHTQKKDAPSGTAISLAEQIMANINAKKKWVNHPSTAPDELPIVSKRIDPAPGTHSIRYSSAIDDIEIIHTAHNRQGFAMGAVLAAEFIAGKQGIFRMRDVLHL